MASRAFTNALSRFADEADGVVTRRRILKDGFEHNEVYDAIERSQLVPIFRGTYAVSRQMLTQRMLVRAAALHLAPAMVAGRSSAECRELLDPRDGVVSLATSRKQRAGTLRSIMPMALSGRPGLVSYRPTKLVEADLVDGLPLATVPRMLFEIAAAEKQWMLERVWKQSDYRGILDLDDLHSALGRTRRRGSPEVRALFMKHPGRFGVEAHYESTREIDFLQLIIDAGLPLPEVNAPVTIDGRHYVADFLWRLLGLVVELDDPSHDRALARQSDARRDSDFFVAGLDVVRFETQTVAADPIAVMRRLAAILDRQRRRTA